MARDVVTCLTIFVLVCGYFNVKCEEDVAKIVDDNWRDILTNEWMVEFYAPWCPACGALENTWKEYGKWAKGMGVKVGKIDVTESPGLSGRFMVTALPTIFHVSNGQFRQFKGSRELDSLMSFIVEEKWKEIEPVPYWKDPDSIQMSVVSTFFKLSTLLRDIHTTLLEDFGLPTWGSYLIFALGTIIVGALLGLVLVLIVDVVYPPSRDVQVRTKSKSDLVSTDQSRKAKCSDDELGDDDIKDDLIDDAATPNEGSKKSNSNNARKRTTRLAD